MSINLGTLQMPVNAATKTFAILAKRGAGKTYTAGVMAEEFFKNDIPFVVFDPIDVWWGLRLSADGKGKGLPIVVFGLEHADILIDRDMGRRIAQAVVRENISCVISTFGMPKVAARHLIAEFSEELLNINNTPRHVFIEEAHEYVPQRVMGGIAKCFSAVEALVVMGRNRGLGVTLINQRAATINKDVLTQLDTLLAFQNTSPQDRKALKDWVEHHSAEGDFEKFMASLPSLPKGKGWIWSPEFMGVFERIEIRKRTTFHPDREKIGSKFVMPSLDQIDVQAFIGKFSAEIKEAKQKEPSVKGKKGKKDEFKYEKPLPDVIHSQPFPDDRLMRDLQNKHESELMIKDAEIRRLQGIIKAVQRAVGSGETVVSGAPAIVPGGALEMWRSKLGNGAATKILDFLAASPGDRFTKPQIGLATGLSMGASTIRVAIGKLKRTGIVVQEGDKLFISPNL